MPEAKIQPTPAPLPLPAAAPVIQPQGVKPPATAPAAAAVCDEPTKKAKEDFKNKGMYGPRNLSPPATKIGAFWAMYFPYAEKLIILVTGKTKFVDGLKLSGTNVQTDEPKLSDFATLLSEIGDNDLNHDIIPAYTWKEKQKSKAQIAFKARLKETIDLWQKPGFSFKVKDTCWEDITAKPEITINVEELGDAQLVSPFTDNTDNLQVRIVKVPKEVEMEEVDAKVGTAIEDKKKANEKWTSKNEKASKTRGAAVSYTKNPFNKTDKGYSVMTLSSSKLDNTPNAKKNKRSLLRRQVFFSKNQTYLKSEQREELHNFHKDFKEADEKPENSMVTMIGHASTSGNPDLNKKITEKRIESTVGYLKNLGFSKTNSRIKTVNASTAEMEEDEKIAKSNPDPKVAAKALEEKPYQRVDLIVGSGELQNTVAHEFGHVFGLDDEYVSK
ncbi:MAG: hypothetical protein WCI92_18885, partial [Bacteroidota bacterium]